MLSERLRLRLRLYSSRNNKKPPSKTKQWARDTKNKRGFLSLNHSSSSRVSLLYGPCPGIRSRELSRSTASLNLFKSLSQHKNLKTSAGPCNAQKSQTECGLCEQIRWRCQLLDALGFTIRSRNTFNNARTKFITWQILFPIQVFSRMS